MSQLARRTVWAALLGTLLAVAGCNKGRPEALGQAQCPDDSYTQTAGPVLQNRCASCHGATVAEANYRVDSYQAAIARRPDGTIRV